MAFPDITPELKSRAPELRGRLMANVSLAESAWFRVGGPAQALFMPEDEKDLGYFLARVPADSADGARAASNVIVRDGGIPGVVVRLGRASVRSRSRTVSACVPAPASATCAVAARAKPASPGSNSCAVFRAGSAVRCA